MADLSVSFLGLKLRNPVLVASSGLTSTKEGVRRAAEAGAGFDLFATGHYARVEPGRDGRPVRRRARHEEKDQSYFLAFLPRARLARVLLPLGDLSKDEVRRIAADAGLPVH
ncbi:MAG TPA: tRNA 2-thiouridine(34) synthase MnmA, partial [Spirochaetales bacterium]|nr:tRNA 2-thiouridine(34) synthase MnmA [Spirochaetales bacterium]